MSRVKWNYNWDKTTVMIYIQLLLYYVKPHTLLSSIKIKVIYFHLNALFIRIVFCLEKQF